MPRNMNLHFINSTETWVYLINEGKTGKFNNNGKAIHDFIETSSIGAGEKKYGKHPTQKPIELMEHFIKLLTDKGDVILDPFMGSGSTGVASVKNERRFFGIEFDKMSKIFDFSVNSTNLKKLSNSIQYFNGIGAFNTIKSQW